MVKIEESVPDLDIHVWYLDDGTIIGDIDKVKKAFDIIIESSPEIGCHLNMKKNEIWWPSRPNNLDCFPTGDNGVKRIPNEGVELLGNPIGSEAFMQNFVFGKQTKLRELDTRLLEINDAQIEFCLLRGCLGFGKINHLLRSCPPSAVRSSFESFDERLKLLFQMILRTPFELSEAAWTQASLPIQKGGLGPVSYTHLAAFLLKTLIAFLLPDYSDIFQYVP